MPNTSPPNSRPRPPFGASHRTENARARTRASELARTPNGPTPALTDAAGEAAPALACLFPRPHSAFFDAPPARQHLMAMVAAVALPDTCGAARELGRELTFHSSKDLVAKWFGDAPGLAGLLSRLTPCAGWTTEDHKRLLEVAAEPAAHRLLSHCKAITPALVRIVENLPPKLRRPRLTALLPCWEIARLIGQLAPIAARAARQPLEDFAKRLDGNRTLADVEAMLRTICLDEPFDSPLAEDARFCRLRRPSEMISASKTLNNCLGKEAYLNRARSGQYAYYVFTGAEDVLAAVELIREPRLGWRLNEFNGRSNAVLPVATQKELADALRAGGVRINEAPAADLLDHLALLARNPPTTPAPGPTTRSPRELPNVRPRLRQLTRSLDTNSGGERAG